MSCRTFKADATVERRHGSDLPFLVCIILLLGFGLFTQYYCTQTNAARLFGDSFYFVKRQLLCVAIGLVLFGLLSTLKIEVIRKILPFLFMATLLLCAATFVPALSVEKNGARRWIRMPFNFTLQSSEVVKFTIVLFLANIFDKQLSIKEKAERNVAPAVLVLLLFTMIVLVQKDLSTALFMFCVCFSMFPVARLNTKWIFAIAVLAIPTLVLFITAEQYRLDRIVAFIRPDIGASTINYQSIAAKRAISAGGLWGNGIGVNLVQSVRIPEVQADYIFASWAEAMGAMGVLAYFFLLGVFTYRGFKVAFTCENRFAALGSFGFTLMITFQSLLNLAVVGGVLPATGLPLPFFSLGGSSIIITLCMCAFVINASRGVAPATEVFEEAAPEKKKRRGNKYDYTGDTYSDSFDSSGSIDTINTIDSLDSIESIGTSDYSEDYSEDFSTFDGTLTPTSGG